MVENVKKNLYNFPEDPITVPFHLLSSATKDLVQMQQSQYHPASWWASRHISAPYCPTMCTAHVSASCKLQKNWRDKFKHGIHCHFRKFLIKQPSGNGPFISIFICYHAMPQLTLQQWPTTPPPISHSSSPSPLLLLFHAPTIGCCWIKVEPSMLRM